MLYWDCFIYCLQSPAGPSKGDVMCLSAKDVTGASLMNRFAIENHLH